MLTTMKDYIDLIRRCSRRGIIDCNSTVPSMSNMLRIKVSCYHVEWLRGEIEENKIVTTNVVVEPFTTWEWLTTWTISVRDHM